MKLEISKEANPNYLAKIVEINGFSPHPNAERLKLANVNGYMIAVGIDTEPGIFVYFPIECQISDWYLKENNLYRKPELNKDPTVKPGFFEEKGRVKAISLRSFISEGFLMPVKSFENYVSSVIEFSGSDIIDAQFDTINGALLVKKYVVKAQHTSGGKVQSASKKYEESIVDGQFRFHPDTEQLRNNLFKFQPSTQIHISSKWHGTSAIFCNLLTKRKLSIIDRIAKFFGANIETQEYKTFCSSRKVIKDPEINKDLQGGFYDVDVWNLAMTVIAPKVLVPGMSVYGEIVGYMPNGKMIQKDYDYGCIYDPKQFDYQNFSPQAMYDAGLFKFMVYRITYTSSDGRVFEMSPKNLQQFCNERDLTPVVEYFYGTAAEFCRSIRNEYIDGLTEDTFENHFLKCLTDTYLEKQSAHCTNNVPDEGIVLRIDQPKFEAYKLKSKKFLEYESKELDKGTEDIEASQE